MGRSLILAPTETSCTGPHEEESGSVKENIRSGISQRSKEDSLEEKRSKPHDGNIENEQPEKAIAPLTGVRFYVCFGSLALSLFLAALDILIVGTIMETVAAKFNGYSLTGWLVTGYNLPNALLSLLWGRLATVWGFKASMLLSIVVFEIGSLVAALAKSMNMLIAGRVVAGFGGSGIQTLCFIILSTLVTDRTRGTAVSILSCAFAVASIVGPFLGGAFATHVTWRWCFYINLPIGGLAFVVFLLSYNPDRENTYENFKILMNRVRRAPYNEVLKPSFYFKLYRAVVFKFDFIEFALCSAGFTLILLGLTFGGNRYSWSSGSIIAYFVVGILLVIASLIYDFVVFDRIKPNTEHIPYMPLLSWRVISKPGVLIPNIATFCTCFAYNCQIVYIVQYFQLVWGDSPWKASVHLIAPVIATVISLVFCGAILKNTGQVKAVLVLGGIIGAVGSGILTLLSPNSNNSAKIGLLILPGVSFGCIQNGAMLSSQIQIPKDHPLFKFDFISVTTFNAFTKMLGTAFGGILSNTVFTTSVHNQLSKIQPPSAHSSSVDELISYWYTNYGGRDSKEVHIFMKAIKDVFWMGLGLAALATIACIFSSNKTLGSKKPVPDSETNEK
ncbi:LAMI_0G17876g1_1 [Lachancea mirantina]|uniref:LAMI_0G17876g1_1 n=1 Tax=Lachancea mirantina TaxID=1230905 RepID=A0A1G4KD41_9SACH|nr:LAMI_0G17876g1_1 [Lachancea mirantina]